MGIRFLQVLAVVLVLVGVNAVAQDSDVVPQSQQAINYSFAPIVKKVSPAVVNIYTKRTVTRQVSPFMADPMFQRFFGQMGMGGLSRQQVESSLGSGVIIEGDGLIITNAHVVKGAEEIVVALSDRREFDAKLALLDEKSDLAILRVDTKGELLPNATLRPSEALEVGDLVMAIGNPFGVGQTVTSGIVSALARSTLNINDYNFFIQTDAAINPGNSGGPLVTIDGGVVGINSAIYSRNGGSLGIGFAIPSEMVATVIAAEKAGGDKPIQRAWLGINAQQVTADIADTLGLNRPMGVLVTKLHDASPLKKAGMETGDVIIKINGRDIHDAAEFTFRLATLPLGEEVSLGVLRKGKPQSFSVVALAPPDSPARDETVLKGNHPLSGVKVANVNPALSVELGLKNETGVAVTDLAQAGGASRIVQRGDIIFAINNVEISSVKELQKALSSATGKGAFALVIERGGQKTQIVIR